MGFRIRLFSQRRKRIYLFLILGTFLFGVAYAPSLIQYYDLKMREVSLDRKIHELEVASERLAEEAKLLEGDPDYLERIAREELGLAKPGEVVYQFVPEVPPENAPPQSSPKSSLDTSLPH